MKIYNEIATIKSNHQIAYNIFESHMYSPNISSVVKPGQFINILPSKDWNKIMRRPMSVASQKEGYISIIYKIFGEGTKLMSQWKENDKIDILGPLGNTWKNYDNAFPILIGGGVGIAPIMNLHNELKTKKIDNILIVGSREKKEHFMEHNPQNNIYLTTDLDDYGIKGNVINALDKILDNINKPVKIFTCGPHGMMLAVKEYCSNNNLDCDFALETIMACGIGICQGCTIIRNYEKNDSYREKYALACIDGPVFNIGELDDTF